MFRCIAATVGPRLSALKYQTTVAKPIEKTDKQLRRIMFFVLHKKIIQLFLTNEPEP